MGYGESLGATYFVGVADHTRVEDKVMRSKPGVWGLSDDSNDGKSHIRADGRPAGAVAANNLNQAGRAFGSFERVGVLADMDSQPRRLRFFRDGVLLDGTTVTGFGNNLRIVVTPRHSNAVATLSFPPVPAFVEMSDLTETRVAAISEYVSELERREPEPEPEPEPPKRKGLRTPHKRKGGGGIAACCASPKPKAGEGEEAADAGSSDMPDLPPTSPAKWGRAQIPSEAKMQKYFSIMDADGDGHLTESGATSGPLWTLSDSFCRPSLCV
jgi:hypothetical protein